MSMPHRSRISSISKTSRYRRHRTASAALALSAALAACGDDATSPTAARTRPDAAVMSATTAADRGDSAAVDSLARGVAHALADAALRHDILRALRESSARRHALPLARFFGTDVGRTVAATAARRSGMRPDRVLATAGVRGGLQLLVPNFYDRVMWAGTPDIVVAGSTATPVELAGRLAARGYTVGGDSVAVPLQHEVSFPLMVIVPAHEPGDSSRADVPRRTGAAATSTISTRDEEMDAMTVSSTTSSCDDPLALQDCDDGSGGNTKPKGITLPSGYTFATCAPGSTLTSSVDRDQDGVYDQCEYELAYAFRPRLAFSSGDCTTYREPYYAVRKAGGVIYVLYLIGYNYDCGSPVDGGSGIGTGAHPGDSEWIMLEVGEYYDGIAYARNMWSVRYATLSAHWRHWTGDYTARYAGWDLEYNYNAGATFMGRATVWVAEGKHANYRSRSVCDAGSNYADNCDRNTDAGQTLNILPFTSGNVGSAFRPTFDQVGSRGGLSGVERLWTGGSFCGWIAGATGCAGPYRSVLDVYAF